MHGQDESKGRDCYDGDFDADPDAPGSPFLRLDKDERSAPKRKHHATSSDAPTARITITVRGIITSPEVGRPKTLRLCLEWVANHLQQCSKRGNTELNIRLSLCDPKLHVRHIYAQYRLGC